MRLRGLPKALAVLVVAAPLVVTGTASSEELEAVVVKAAPAQGFLAKPSADGRWIAWNHWKGENSNLFVQRGDEPRIRVNPKGVDAFNGALYRHTLIYEKANTSTDADLYRFDLRTGKRIKLPEQVNTRRAREFDPSLSGRYLLFGRALRKDQHYIQRVMLYDRRTKELSVLARSREWTDCHACTSLNPGQVNGRWAVWISFIFYEGGSDISVTRYNIRRDTTTPVAHYEALGGTDSAVSSDGTVYVNKRTIGPWNGIVKYPLQGPEEVVYSEEASELFVEDRAQARHVYFSADQGIYKIIEPLP